MAFEEHRVSEFPAEPLLMCAVDMANRHAEEFSVAFSVCHNYFQSVEKKENQFRFGNNITIPSILLLTGLYFI